MGKKSFSGGLDSLLESTVEEKEVKESISKPKAKKIESVKSAAPTKKTPEKKSASVQDIVPEETKTTLLLKKEILKMIKALAYWDRRLMKDLVHEALEAYIETRGETYVQQAMNGYKDRSR